MTRIRSFSQVAQVALALFGFLAITAIAAFINPSAAGLASFGLVGAAGTIFADDDLGKRLKSQGMISQIVSLNPASIASGAEGTATVAVTGLTPDHVITVTPKADVTVGLYVRGARCEAAGTLTVDLANTSGGAIDEAAFDCNLIAFPKLA